MNDSFYEEVAEIKNMIRSNRPFREITNKIYNLRLVTSINNNISTSEKRIRISMCAYLFNKITPNI